ncbi:MAG TPA: protein kinase [Ktedonobacteraceae bacterium]|nr:protein kinase [Ktedonobacteraceae bacterium]
MSTFESQKTGKLAPQSILIKRYLLVQLIGRGGMSAIYLSLDLQRDRSRVAIKEMSQENLDEEELTEALARFQQEARLLKQLQHPNLPAIYDAFNTGGRSFLVMDYIDGKTLLQLLQEGDKPLPVNQVINYAEQLCDVLAYLHQQKPPIIFRDLKPTNVMVTPQGRVCLIDFGIARLFKEGQSQDTVVLGSPGYAPPEQHGSGQTNPRSDLYALGATLHCCLSNRDPYNAPDRFTFAPVRRFNPLVPPELDALTMRLLELDENKRPASALEVKQALREIRQHLQQQSEEAAKTVVAPLTPRPTEMPTQYAFSAPANHQATQAVTPALEQTPPQQGPLILRSTPIPPSQGAVNQGGPPSYPGPGGYPGQNYPAYSTPGQANRTQPTKATRVWTPGFITVFLVLLLITLGGSSLIFTVLYPAISSTTARLDHPTEAGLVAVALILSFLMIAMTRSLIAAIIIILNVVAMFGAGFAFLLQTLRDIQPSAQIFSPLGPTEVNQIITFTLLGAGIVLLFWLFRLPFTWGDRIWLFFFAAAVCICAFIQFLYHDDAVEKHLFLLATLILFIQGTLTAGQMERKRKRS